MVLLSAKNMKLRLQFSQVDQNWRLEDGKMLSGLVSLQFFCDIQDVGLEFGASKKASILLSVKGQAAFSFHPLKTKTVHLMMLLLAE